MYVNGFVIAVPEGNQDAYRAQAATFWPMAKKAGALEQMEAWESDVQDGKQTDFRRAVAAEPGEKIVFAWVTWPNKATADAFHEQLINDPAMHDLEMPFDGKRAIFGGFTPIFHERAN